MGRDRPRERPGWGSMGRNAEVGDDRRFSIRFASLPKGGTMIKVYASGDSRSRRVLWACEEVGAPYEVV